MLSYIRDHWIVYLVGAILAIALGAGAAYLVGVVGSTPPSAHEQAAAAEDGAASQGSASTEAPAAEASGE